MLDDDTITQFAQSAHVLQAILDTLRKGEEWGGFGDAERLYWDPASATPQLGPSAEFAYDGTFVSVGIFNLSGGSIRVALTPNASLRDRSSLLTLRPYSFIVLPYRGTTVSVSGDAAGSALVIAFDVPQPFSAGSLSDAVNVVTTAGAVAWLSTDDQDGRGTATALGLPTVGARGFLFSGGSSWDRAREASATNLAAQSGLGAQLVTLPGEWSITNAAAANTQATATKAAGAAGVRHVVTAINAKLAAGSGAVTLPVTPVRAVVRDGTTGAGTILWDGYLSIPATPGAADGLAATGLNIPGSAATAMTVEFNGAGGAGTFESVSLQGYDAS